MNHPKLLDVKKDPERALDTLRDITPMHGEAPKGSAVWHARGAVYELEDGLKEVNDALGANH